MALVRPVSGVERLWLAAGRIAPPFAVLVIVEGRGAVALDALRDAAQRTPAARLRARGWLGWSAWHDDGPAAAVAPLPAGWDGLGSAPFLSAPLHPERGQGLRLWTGPGCVAMEVHHALADGRGALSTLSALLTGDVDGTTTVTDAAVARPLRTTWKGSPSDDCSALLPLRGAPGLDVHWRRLRLGAVRSRPLARAIASLSAHLPDDASARFDVPVDLRRHVADSAPFGNLTGLLRIPATTDIDRVEALLRDGLAAGLHLDFPLSGDVMRWFPVGLAAAIGRRAALRAQANQRYSTTATVSNLGRVDLDAFRTPTFEPERVCVVAPGSPGLPAFFTLTGHTSGLDLAVTAPRALASEADLDRLLAELGEALSA